MAAPRSDERDSHDLAHAKARVRADALAARGDPALGALLAAHVLRDLQFAPGSVISGFWPMRREIDIRPLLLALHERGHLVLLPVTPRPGQALVFRRWRPGAPMLREAFGTSCPSPDAAEGSPATLLVPLAAFDRRGGRLGYGGGYYDRTLAALPGALPIGCAFAAQEVPSVPIGPHDIPLFAVATELGVIMCDNVRSAVAPTASTGLELHP